MTHFPKPFFRKSRKTWAVQLNGKQINLGHDKNAAFRRYHELMAAPVEQPRVADTSLVVALCDNFLSWVQKHRSAATYEWYRHRLQRFVPLTTESDDSLKSHSPGDPKLRFQGNSSF